LGYGTFQGAVKESWYNRGNGGENRGSMMTESLEDTIMWMKRLMRYEARNSGQVVIKEEEEI
jgi:hypothetical protein